MLVKGSLETVGTTTVSRSGKSGLKKEKGGNTYWEKQEEMGGKSRWRWTRRISRKCTAATLRTLLLSFSLCQTFYLFLFFLTLKGGLTPFLQRRNTEVLLIFRNCTQASISIKRTASECISQKKLFFQFFFTKTNFSTVTGALKSEKNRIK